MTLQRLASLIAKREGKKSQARIGDIREILKIIVTLSAQSATDDGTDQGSDPITALVEAAGKEQDRLESKRAKQKH